MSVPKTIGAKNPMKRRPTRPRNTRRRITRKWIDSRCGISFLLYHDEFSQRTRFVCTSCGAMCSPVINEAVGKIEPLVFRVEQHKISLDFYRVPMFRKAEKAGKAA